MIACNKIVYLILKNTMLIFASLYSFEVIQVSPSESIKSEVISSRLENQYLVGQLFDYYRNVHLTNIPWKKLVKRAKLTFCFISEIGDGITVHRLPYRISQPSSYHFVILESGEMLRSQFFSLTLFCLRLSCMK